MREQFEKLPEIAVHLNHGNVFFSEEMQAYVSEFSSLHFVACFVNGAWYAYQEQQKKIDSMKSKIQDIWTNLDDRQSKECIIESCESVIQGLLK